MWIEFAIVKLANLLIIEAVRWAVLVGCGCYGLQIRTTRLEPARGCVSILLGPVARCSAEIEIPVFRGAIITQNNHPIFTLCHGVST